ncbi:hypothetical protein TYRP_006119, partial [Tyrophagus putrescentiae]
MEEHTQISLMAQRGDLDGCRRKDIENTEMYLKTACTTTALNSTSITSPADHRLMNLININIIIIIIDDQAVPSKGLLRHHCSPRHPRFIITNSKHMNRKWIPSNRTGKNRSSSAAAAPKQHHQAAVDDEYRNCIIIIGVCVYTHFS